MIITAKFPSRCASCGNNIGAGDRIEWKKGSPAVHERCAGRSVAPKAAAPKHYNIPRSNVTPKAPKKSVDTTGCISLTRRSQDRHDNYDVGQLLHATRISGGGGHDGHYFTVVKVERKWKDDDTDEWMVSCWARAATDAECGVASDARRTKEWSAEQKKQICSLIREVGKQVPELEIKGVPAGRQIVINAGVHGSGVEKLVVDETGTISLYWGGHYDDYRQSLWTTCDPQVADLLASIEGKVTTAQLDKVAAEIEAAAKAAS